MPTALNRIFGKNRASSQSRDGLLVLRSLQALLNQPNSHRRYVLMTRLLRRGPFETAVVVAASQDTSGRLRCRVEASAAVGLDLEGLQESLSSRISPLAGMTNEQSRWMVLQDDPFGPGSGFLRKFGLACYLVLSLNRPGDTAEEQLLLLLASTRALSIQEPHVQTILAGWSLYQAVADSMWSGGRRSSSMAIPWEWPGSAGWSTAPAALAIIDGDEILQVNEAAEKILRESVGSDGRSWRLWLVASVRRLEISGRERETLTASRARKRSLEVALGPPLAMGRGRVVAVRDATAEVNADTQRSETISTLSHELRTPLTSMKNSVGLVLRGDAGELTSGQKRFLALTMRNIDRLDRLITDLLDVSQAEAGRLCLRRRVVDLGIVLREALDMLAATARQRNITLDYNDLPASFPAHVDGDKVVQMILNTAGNALKYTEEGGRVQIWLKGRTGELPVLTSLIAERFFLPLQTFTLVIEDNGIGISKEVLENLFDPFRRGREAEATRLPGSGLGLHITRGLVHAHGGSIGLSSAPHKGTTVWIVLPRDPDSERVLVAGRKLALNWIETEDDMRLVFLDARRPDLEPDKEAWSEAGQIVNGFLNRLESECAATGQPRDLSPLAAEQSKMDAPVAVEELTGGLWAALIRSWSRLEAAWQVEIAKPSCPQLLIATGWDIWERPQEMAMEDTSQAVARAVPIQLGEQ